MELEIKDKKVFISKTDINETHDLALRIFDSKGVRVDYKSTRIGGLFVDKTGVSFDCPNEFAGCEFEIKDLQNSKAGLSGKLVKAKPAKVTSKETTRGEHESD
ncbi:MAG: hypothetical protein PHX51_07165 [Clostridia bacterium]|nr:hypothetical protein [Clostridia bacterium]